MLALPHASDTLSFIEHQLRSGGPACTSGCLQVHWNAASRCACSSGHAASEGQQWAECVPGGPLLALEVLGLAS